MSQTFVVDLEDILLRLPSWMKSAILGEQSRMRQILFLGSSSPSGDDKSWYSRVPEQLILLVRRKIALFDQFTGAIRKLLNFFKIAKVSQAGEKQKFWK